MNLLRRNAWPLLASVGLLFIPGALSGCAGVVAVVRGSSEFQLEQPVLVSHNTLSSHHRGPPLTVERLLTGFGEPDEIIALGTDRERWRYRTDVRFHGVGLLLIVIPIPLLVPTGIHDTYVEIERGTVVRVRGSQNSNLARIGCMIGALAALSGDQGCFAKRGTPSNQVRLGSGVLWLGPPPTLRRAPVVRHRGGSREHRLPPDPSDATRAHPIRAVTVTERNSMPFTVRKGSSSQRSEEIPQELAG